MEDYNLQYQIGESRKFRLKKLQAITSERNCRFPKHITIKTTFSEVESLYNIFEPLKSEIEAKLANLSPAKKRKIIFDKIEEIRDKYNYYQADNFDIDNDSDLISFLHDQWPLNILVFRLFGGGADLDLTYLGGHLLKAYIPDKQFGYQFENELENIAQGVADSKLLRELKQEQNKILKDNNSHFPNSTIRSLAPVKKISSKKKSVEVSIKIEIDKVIVPELWRGLKPFFKEEQHKLLLETLLGNNGNRVPLVFEKLPSNRFLEVFRRASYNRRISGTKVSLAKWISHHFCYIPTREGKKKGKKMPFTNYCISTGLSRDKGDIPELADRICNIPALPYCSISELKERKKR